LSKKLEKKDAVDDLRVNAAWFETPNDWSCPVCKRSKLELIRADDSGKLFASLEDHHDHISGYIKDFGRELIKSQRSDKHIDEDESRFLKHRLTPFLERFQRTLICGDCNAADSAAKQQIGDVCKYFSFSPREIREFIEVASNCPHRIMYADAKRVFEGAAPFHHERKALAATWLDRALVDGIHWAEPKSGPGRAHYRTISRAVVSFEENISDDWDTLWKGKDTNLGKSLTGRVKIKEERRTARRCAKKKSRDKGNADPVTPKPATQTAKKPSNAGKSWSPEADRELKVRFTRGESISELAEDFGRTDGSIRARLIKFGLIEE